MDYDKSIFTYPDDASVEKIMGLEKLSRLEQAERAYQEGEISLLDYLSIENSQRYKSPAKWLSDSARHQLRTIASSYDNAQQRGLATPEEAARAYANKVRQIGGPLAENGKLVNEVGLHSGERIFPPSHDGNMNTYLEATSDDYFRRRVNGPFRDMAAPPFENMNNIGDYYTRRSSLKSPGAERLYGDIYGPNAMYGVGPKYNYGKMAKYGIGGAMGMAGLYGMYKYLNEEGE